MTTNDTFEDGASSGLCQHHIDAFLTHLRQAGYRVRSPFGHLHPHWREQQEQHDGIGKKTPK